MYRDLFVPHNGIYLLNHSVGRPFVSTKNELMESFFNPWESGDAEVWPSWINQIERFRSSLGRLLNANTADFCPQSNLSSAVTKIIHSLPTKTGKTTIICSEQDFPSIGFVLGQAERRGYKLRMIPATLDTQDLNVWLESFTNDVAIVLLTQVYSNTSQQIPVAEITSAARQRGIHSIVDICQAIGVVPIDVQAWQADFIVGSCVKWLCGGPGAGFLWVDPNVVPLCQPVDVGWFSHINPFEFDINNFTYANDALRFWGGTPSVMPFALAASSVERMCDIGVSCIREHNLKLGNIILDALPSESIVTPRKASQRGGTVVLNLGKSQTTAEENLSKAHVRFDSRGYGVRISPHIYNTKEEMDIVTHCIIDSLC